MTNNAASAPAANEPTPGANDALAELDRETIRNLLSRRDMYTARIENLETNHGDKLFDYTDEDRTYKLAQYDLAETNKSLASFMPDLLALLDAQTERVAELERALMECKEQSK